MRYEEIIERINNCDTYSVLEEREVGNSKQIILDNGAIINSFYNGNHNVQGKNIQEVKDFLNGSNKTSKKKIFVVYGHDDMARMQLEALLRRWDLEPIILDQMASSGQTIIEKLEEYTQNVEYAIVLATPDDIGRAKDAEEDKYRVRQNVVLELGMFLAKLGREKVAILLREEKDFEKPTDIQGIIYIPFQKSVEEASVSLIRELAKQGYVIDATRI